MKIGAIINNGKKIIICCGMRVFPLKLLFLLDKGALNMRSFIEKNDNSIILYRAV